MGTHDAFRPAHRFQQFSSVFFVTKFFDERGKVETDVTVRCAHGLSPLAFCGESGHNLFVGQMRACSAFGLGPTPVSAGAGPLINGPYGPLASWRPDYPHGRVLLSAVLLQQDGFIFATQTHWPSSSSSSAGCASSYCCNLSISS